MLDKKQKQSVENSAKQPKLKINHGNKKSNEDYEICHQSNTSMVITAKKFKSQSSTKFQR